ncbi:hypothetical protein Taro_027151 [Colocasia esculenta]|uniref:Uncharacterized protein n=1 Tax=Colocasia esculenta TaxID=4460 RepID=A0A843VTF8_COLES|nr:hypothetical protein [Colocasia esculenta]
MVLRPPRAPSATEGWSTVVARDASGRQRAPRAHRGLTYCANGPQWSPKMPMADNEPLDPTGGLTYYAGESWEKEDA